MSPLGIFQNPVLVAAIVAWSIAQAVKPPIEYLRRRQWNWAILFQTGGMPSSHSALVTAAAYGAGLTAGFDSPIFAVALVLALIVVYDATGIRRQAGRHASIINAMIRDLFEGHPMRQEQLKEVLGHSPVEAFVGVLLGLAAAHILVPRVAG